MRLISYNVNGLRSAIRKGFLDWLSTDPADVICLQEIKATPSDIDVGVLAKLGFDHYWYPAEKKGYSGVAIFTKRHPDAVFYGNGIMQSDAEGRIIRADFDNITLINAYFPSGTSGTIRQTYKYQWLDEFHAYLLALRNDRPHVIVCGDYNIAHKAIDIHNPVGNKNSSGFLPEERAWLDNYVESGMIDTFRYFNPHPHQYTWWSQRFPTVRAQNKGWRIDYFMVTESLKNSLKDALIMPDVKHSDHCPVYLEISV